MNANEARDPSEAESLLAGEERDSFDFDSDTASVTSAAPESAQPQQLPRWKNGRRGFAARFQAQKPSTIILLLAVIMFTITTSGLLLLIPMFRLVEDAICHVHYGKGRSEPIEEQLCKIDPVQKELAFLGGLGAMIGSVVGLVSILPYGVLADRIGRKPAFLLAYTGMFLAFAWGPLVLVIGETPNVRLALLGSLFFLIGGGVQVAMNTLNAMASDVSSEADRASGFLHLSFGAVLGGLIAPVTAGLLMEHMGPWFPVILVFCITPLILVLVLFLPETLPIKLKEAAAPEEPQTFTERLRAEAKELGVSLSLLRNPNITLTLPIFLIQPVMFAAYSSTLAQHISTYFHWSLAQTNYLLSPLSILQLLIIALLPMASGLLTNPSGRFKLSVFSKDLLLTKLSLLLLITGALVEGFSREIVLFIVGLTVGTLGSCIGPLCRAITTSYVEPQQTSRLYALLSLLETGGTLLGGPVLAWCFNIGLSNKGLWVGLPWFYVTMLLVICLASVSFLRAPKAKPTVADPGEEENGDLGYQSAGEEV